MDLEMSSLATKRNVLLIESTLLSLALVRRWGRIFPDWMPFLGGRKVPRLIIITVGWFAAGLTIPIGVLAILGSIMQTLRLSGDILSKQGANADTVYIRPSEDPETPLD